LPVLVLLRKPLLGMAKRQLPRAKDGKQALTLKAGVHTIAVKVVDNDGLENTEIIQLKINGVLEKMT